MKSAAAMKKVLHLSFSPHGATTRGYDLARRAIANLSEAQPGIHLTERDVATSTLPHMQPAYASAITSLSPHSSPAFQSSEELISELQESHYLVISTPMHNFTVPASFKLWIDYVVRKGRTFTTQAGGYKVGMLEDRPALVVVSSGGTHSGEDARQPDFLSPYVTHILETIGIKDVRFIYLQGMSRPETAAQSIAVAGEMLASDPVFGEAVAAL
ncbi:MAG: NAD(P)H-dependent oxidoreductase [Rhizobiaceae bacterium]|nr:NAD(P)H-dependent oxidoreductase [Rhizobiaceae bacterium]